jgi:hypothetical protein
MVSKGPALQVASGALGGSWPIVSGAASAPAAAASTQALAEATTNLRS